MRCEMSGHRGSLVEAGPDYARRRTLVKGCSVTESLSEETKPTLRAATNSRLAVRISGAGWHSQQRQSG